MSLEEINSQLDSALKAQEKIREKYNQQYKAYLDEYSLVASSYEATLYKLLFDLMSKNISQKIWKLQRKCKKSTHSIRDYGYTLYEDNAKKWIENNKNSNLKEHIVVEMELRMLSIEEMKSIDVVKSKFYHLYHDNLQCVNSGKIRIPYSGYLTFDK